MSVQKSSAFRILPVLLLLFLPIQGLCGEAMIGPGKFWEIYGGSEIFTSGRASGSVSGWTLEENKWSSSGSADFAPAAALGIRYVDWTGGTDGVFMDVGTLNAEAKNADLKTLLFSVGLARSLSSPKEIPARAGFEPSIGAGVLFGIGNLRVKNDELTKSVSSLCATFGADIFLEAAYLFPSGKGIALRYRIMPAIAAFNDESIAAEKARASFVAHAFTVGYVF